MDMKKTISILILSLITITNLIAPVFAQNIETTNNEGLTTDNEETLNNDEENKYLKANINSSSNIELEKNTLFNANFSYIPENSENVTYKWDFGDGNSNEGIEVFHAYKTPGKYTVTLELRTQNYESIEKKDIFVYNKLILLITDITKSKDKFNTLKKLAEDKDVYITILDAYGSNTEFISEEILSKKLTENKAEIQKANQIVIWTNEFAGLNALSRFLQTNENREIINNKDLIIIYNNYKSQLTRIENLSPTNANNSMLITREGAIYPIIESLNRQDLLEKLENEGHEYIELQEIKKSIRPWNFMSYFVKILINQGIPDNTIALLLLLPVIVTFLTFLRQVIGITSHGLYTPTIMTLSFLILGMGAGLVILLTAVTIGIIVKTILRNTNMLFIPKVAIGLTSISLALLVLLTINSYIQLFNSEYLSLAIFPILILSTLIENLVKVKNNKIIAESFKLLFVTILVALAAYGLAGGELNFYIANFKFTYIKTLMLNYPELILILLVLNILMGKWTGLKVLEKYRFREILKHIEEEEE